ncbi:hypothetical protein SUBVAR_07129 [Subdoligranulum variabile DSM 15176]|uniref:Uncharacterized protein n=1 Tax=Subdoligranulum variabile DSM 15176 TaxID=411471 RepID=D1PRU9_9FIRM|nr:hypothetical protein SUBVAR_07129 [Subdoligranulum variabile DSM 15176]
MDCWLARGRFPSGQREKPFCREPPEQGNPREGWRCREHGGVKTPPYSWGVIFMLPYGNCCAGDRRLRRIQGAGAGPRAAEGKSRPKGRSLMRGARARYRAARGRFPSGQREKRSAGEKHEQGNPREGWRCRESGGVKTPPYSWGVIFMLPYGNCCAGDRRLRRMQGAGAGPRAAEGKSRPKGRSLMRGARARYRAARGRFPSGQRKKQSAGKNPRTGRPAGRLALPGAGRGQDPALQPSKIVDN